MKNIIRYIFSVIFALLWGVSLYLGFSLASNALSQRDQEIKSRIIHECAQDYRVETVNTTTGKTVFRPLEQQVRECIWQKGIRSGWEGVWSKSPEESAAAPAENTISKK